MIIFLRPILIVFIAISTAACGNSSATKDAELVREQIDKIESALADHVKWYGDKKEVDIDELMRDSYYYGTHPSEKPSLVYRGSIVDIAYPLESIECELVKETYDNSNTIRAPLVSCKDNVFYKHEVITRRSMSEWESIVSSIERELTEVSLDQKQAVRIESWETAYQFADLSLCELAGAAVSGVHYYKVPGTILKRPSTLNVVRVLSNLDQAQVSPMTGAPPRCKVDSKVYYMGKLFETPEKLKSDELVKKQNAERKLALVKKRDAIKKN